MAVLPRLALALGAAALLALAPPAGAEFYRWVDDQGRESFAMDLHQVPKKHRAEALRRAELEKLRAEPEPEAINTMKTPDNAAAKRALRPRRSAYGRSSATVVDTGCASWQREKADRLRRDVARWEKQVDLYEQRERRMVRTEDRLHAANQVESNQIYLEQAEAALEDFEDSLRRKGVPPGCYR